MVLVGGIDIPIIEVLLVMIVIILILLIESIIIIVLLMKQMGKTKKVGQAVEKLSEAILQVKKAELEELDKLVKR